MIYYRFSAGVLAGILISIIIIHIQSDSIKRTANRKNEKVNAGKNEKQIRLLCWVLTYPGNHLTKAIHVNRTWGRRCDKLIFMSSQTDEYLDVIALPNVQEDYDNLFGKTREALRYVWTNHRNDYDWFLKADDDTYLIVENLKHLLAGYKTSQPVVFGLHRNASTEWVDGGAGYILSKESLRRFVEEALPYIQNCSGDGREDRILGYCLIKCGVKIMDTRDVNGRHRFMHYPPNYYTYPRIVPPEELATFQWKSQVHRQNIGIEWWAKDVISFHHVKPKHMYTIEYMVYHLRAYGVKTEETYVQHYPLEFF